MTYIVNEKCIKCKYTDCVEVCPVDCFYEGENMLVIHPDECIDCGVCEPECPVEAIKPDTEPNLEKWLELNRRYSESGLTLRPRSRHHPTLMALKTSQENLKNISLPTRVPATEQVCIGGSNFGTTNLRSCLRHAHLCHHSWSAAVRRPKEIKFLRLISW